MIFYHCFIHGHGSGNTTHSIGLLNTFQRTWWRPITAERFNISMKSYVHYLLYYKSAYTFGLTIM